MSTGSPAKSRLLRRSVTSTWRQAPGGAQAMNGFAVPLRPYPKPYAAGPPGAGRQGRPRLPGPLFRGPVHADQDRAAVIPAGVDLEHVLPGFTHCCRTTRKGRSGLGRRPVGKRASRTLKRIRAEPRRRMRDSARDVARWPGRAAGGWLRHHAAPTGHPSLRGSARRVRRPWPRVLRRRPRRDRFRWSGTDALARVFWPRPRIPHPWPGTRLAVSHPRQEPLPQRARGDPCGGRRATGVPAATPVD